MQGVKRKTHASFYTCFSTILRQLTAQMLEQFVTGHMENNLIAT